MRIAGGGHRMLGLGKRLTDNQQRELKKIASRLSKNTFFDRAALISSIISESKALNKALEQKRLRDTVNSLKSHGYKPSAIRLSSNEVDTFILICRRLGISDFGYPLRDLILAESRLLSGVLSVLNLGNTNSFRERMAPSTRYIVGIYEMFLRNSRSNVRTFTAQSAIRRRILMISRWKMESGDVEQVVVEIELNETTRNNESRFGILIPDQPEFTTMLSPFDLYNVINDLSQITGEDIREYDHPVGIQSLQFAVNDDGLTGSYQESSRESGTFYARRIGEADRPTFSQAIISLAAPRLFSPLELEKIERNLSGQISPGRMRQYQDDLPGGA